MQRHLVIASFNAAFAGAIAMTLIGLRDFGSVSLVFGIIMFPFALITTFVSANVLVYMKNKLNFSKVYFLPAILLFDFMLGGFVPIVVFGISVLPLTSNSIIMFSTYGFLGVVCGVAAWLYLRNHITN